MLWILVVLLLAVPASSLAAGPYYISTSGSNSNPCTESQPCQTFEHVRANRLAAGETVYFRAGSYPGIRVTAAQNIPSGTSNSNRTTIAGYPGEFPYIDTIDVVYNDVPGNPSKRGLTQYVTFKNFKARSIGASGCQQVYDGIDMTCGAHFIRFEDLEVTNNNAATSCVNGGFGATDTEHVHLLVHHCGADRLDHGFYVCVPNALYERIDVHSNSGYGLQLYESGHYWPCGSGMIVRNSYIHHNGTVDGAGATLADGDNIQFYNNIVAFNPSGGADFVFSGNKPDLHNLQVYNNTFYGNGGSALTLGNPCCGSETVQVDPKIRNNLFSNNNNNINERNVSNPQYTNNLCPSLSTGCTHTGNPALTNPGGADFSLQGQSAARNQGTPLSTFTTDYIGEQRGQGGAWDIGAYEYKEGGGQVFDFLVPSPGTKTVVQGASVTFAVTATLNGGTAAPVTFSVTGLPSGVSASFTSNPCTPSCTANLTLTATGGAPVGTYATPLLVGTSGSLVRDTNFTITVTAATAAVVKAFPTAEGLGAAETSGGRGGVVMEITTLADAIPAPANSFRACAEGTGPRICVFRVGGMINLVERVYVKSDVTIAGQTAPGEGVTIRYYPIYINNGAHNVIIRHLRHRQAYTDLSIPNNSTCGGFFVYGDGGLRVSNVILDHVSAGWECDDSTQAVGFASNVTYQWSLVGEPYECRFDGSACQIDPYGGSKGFIVQTNDPTIVAQTSVAFHHNIITNSVSRNPASGPFGLTDVRYNLVYNWNACESNVAFGGRDSDSTLFLQNNVNFVGNVYIPGPDTSADFTGAGCKLGVLQHVSDLRIYVQDNETPYCGGSACAANTWNLGFRDDNYNYPPHEATFRVSVPFAAPAIVATPRAQMESTLKAKVGAIVPKRDGLDTRLIGEITSRTGGMGRAGAPLSEILVASCNGVSTTPPCTAAPTDTDHDGMPDAWETAHGLNPNSAADGPAYATNGYTNVENYLNELAGDTIPTAPTSTFDFALVTPGDHTIARGATRDIPLTVNLVSGTGPPVPTTLSVTTALPSGVTATFSTNPCTPSCTVTLTLTVAGAATVGTTPLTIHGTGGSQAHDVSFDLTVSNIVSTANPMYVRKTAGSPTNDCIAAENPATAKQTIADACQCMTVPGKVMYIEGNGHTYVEQIDTGGGCPITGGNGPSYDTATRLEGYGSPVPVIQAPVGANMALWLRGSGDKYIIVKKLLFDAANQAPNAIAVFAIEHHIRFEQIEAKNTGGGFETFYLTGASNIELIDVFLHDAGTHALTLDAGVSNFLCRRCHLLNAAQKGLNINSNGTKTNLTFDTLEVRNNGGSGVDLGASTGTVLQNILSHSNGGTGVVVRSGASGTRAYNNTIYGNSGIGLQCESGATSTELRNNIVYGNTGGNLVNNCGATVAKNLCAATSAACALGGDPLFVAAPGDLHLADGSPGIDAGDNIPSILTDYAGNARQQGQQDIGAFERTQTTGEGGTDVTEPPCNLLAASMYF
jgi:Right handed beta helix region